MVGYCSRECQANDWNKGHKKVCKKWKINSSFEVLVWSNICWFDNDEEKEEIGKWGRGMIKNGS